MTHHDKWRPLAVRQRGDLVQDFVQVTAWTTSWSGGHRPCSLGLASRMLGL